MGRMSKTIPMICPKCCDELVETDEGVVPGFYGRLIFPTDPPNPQCVNCETLLVVSGQQSNVTRYAPAT